MTEVKNYMDELYKITIATLRILINLFIFNATTQTNLEMNSKDVDILNVILIVISLYAAFHIPFGLFIFSYVVLGPLHYLTEINWLKEKEYFLGKANWSYLFILFAFFLALPFILKLPLFDTFMKNESIQKYYAFLNNTSDEIYLIALIVTIGLLYFKNKNHLILFIVISSIIAVFSLNHFTSTAMSIAIFIPTLIHVYVFTTLFMIYGMIKNKTTPGIISIILMLMVPLIIIFSKINPEEYNGLSDYTQTSYIDSTFGGLNLEIAKWFIPIKGSDFNFLSVLGIKIQIFVAFAYTYHYLNWFSKTSIIRWDKTMTKSKIITILAIWGISVCIYLVNFKIGYIILIFLSLIHVLLEFPLNVTTIKVLLNKLNVPLFSKN